MQELEPLKELARLIEEWEDAHKLQDSIYCAYQIKPLLPALAQHIEERERLVRAAALREAAVHFESELKRVDSSAVAAYLHSRIPPADQKALDAHDADAKSLARIVLYQHSVAGEGHAPNAECETCKLARRIADGSK